MTEDLGKKLERMIRSMPEDKKAAVAWVMENYDTLDRILSKEPLEINETTDIAVDATVREDYYMLALILYKEVRDFGADYFGSLFRS